MKRAVVVLLALALSLPAFADKPGPATAQVKAANEKISTLLKQKVPAGSQAEKDQAAKVTSSVRDFLDIDELGKRAMSDQWSKLTPAQQTEFLSTLRSLIEANYVAGLRQNLDYSVDYTGESVGKDGDTVVTTQINTKRHGHPYKIEVDYVLHADAGKLRAWDVSTDGVGLVDNYRAMFNKIMASDGFGGLIGKMKKKQSEAQGAQGG
jgi:ABC-type transporter MlaC component